MLIQQGHYRLLLTCQAYVVYPSRDSNLCCSSDRGLQCDPKGSVHAGYSTSEERGLHLVILDHDGRSPSTAGEAPAACMPCNPWT